MRRRFFLFRMNEKYYEVHIETKNINAHSKTLLLYPINDHGYDMRRGFYFDEKH